MKLKIITFTLLALLIAILIAATIIEKISGTEYVRNNIYNSLWFITLWGIECVCAFVYIIKQKVCRRPAVLLLHCSFVMILVGALVTHIFGIQGSAYLRAGKPTNAFVNRENEKIEMLPFAVTLKCFRLETYPGTQSPMDYVSVVEVTGESKIQTMSISMNNIGEYSSYRFYQLGYDPDMQGTYLSVSHDPYGIAVTYTGYTLLFISMVLFMVLPNERFRKLLRSQYSKVVALLLFFGISISASASGPKTLSKEMSASFGNLYAYYNGRICPLQTVAIDFTTKLYGKSSYKGYSAEQVFVGWMLFPTTWLNQPMIKIKGAKTLELLHTDKKYVSYNDFFRKGSYTLEKAIDQIHLGKDVPDSRAITEADEKMNILLMLSNGRFVKIYPVMNHSTHYSLKPSINWYSQGDILPPELPHGQWIFIKHSMDYIRDLAVSGNYTLLRSVIIKIRDYQKQTATKLLLPSDFVFKSEKLYNNINYTKPLAMALVTIGIIAFIICLVFMAKGNGQPVWTEITYLSINILVVLYLFVFISLRSIVSGHLPLANGYETMQFMSMCSLLLTLCLWKKSQLIPSFGFILAGLTLLVSMMGQSNPQITPLMPVLSSPLLSIHVCIIMIAYTLFAFIMLNSIAALVMNKRNPGFSISTYHFSLTILYPAVFLLTTGIFIGAIWANVSWGRYWGWDPKEVWALITLLVYSFPLHHEKIRLFQKPTYFHIYMILSFLTVIITYFGVNFFLGGMHSYAGN